MTNQQQEDRYTANAAFELAIATGRLSNRSDSPVYAGHFMYMGEKHGRSLFKAIRTREYLP